MNNNDYLICRLFILIINVRKHWPPAQKKLKEKQIMVTKDWGKHWPVFSNKLKTHKSISPVKAVQKSKRWPNLLLKIWVHSSINTQNMWSKRYSYHWSHPPLIDFNDIIWIKIQTGIGRCEPVSRAVNASVLALCKETVLPFVSLS